jgi:hypothetical protein
VAAKQATGMVEKVNDILQRILNKTGELHLFAERLQKSVSNSIAGRSFTWITLHLKSIEETA